MVTLHLVKLPLILTATVGDIRTVNAMAIGITTIAAFIGVGCLRDFMTQGLSLLILLSTIPTMLLAIALDCIITCIEMSVTRLTIKF